MTGSRVWILLVCAVLAGSAAAAPVVISEFLASNDLGLADFEGSHPDWIELYNPGPGAVDLGGSYLTDDAALLTKWRIPTPTMLAPGAFRVVFASDKDRAVAGQELHTNFKLSTSGEYLALVAPDGITITYEYAPTFPLQVSDVSFGLSFNPIVSTTRGYFMAPTPGASNGIAGSAVLAVTHTPLSPGDLDDIDVEALVAPAAGATVTSASMTYRIGFGSEVSAAMSDNGVAPDRVGLDGIWTARISHVVSSPGQMVRWRITANSTAGVQARLPLYLSATASRQYFGTVVADPATVSPLSNFTWWVQNPGDADVRMGTRCTVHFLDELYDNVFVRVRGNTSSGWPKKSYKFDFNPGDHFRFDPAEERVEEFNLNSTYGDKAFLRLVLAGETHNLAGVAGSLAAPWRVQQNGTFYSVAIFVEQPDEELLERTGLDPRGALYKMYNQMTDAYSGVAKKTRLFEANGDLQALVTGCQLSGTPLETYIFDNIDLPAVVNYLAATSLMHDNDHVAKNYYVYRDSEGDREWQFIPWDKDLTYGRNYNWGGVLNDTMWADLSPYSHPLFGDVNHQKIDGLWNRLIDAAYRTPRAQTMMLRRLRTLSDQFLQPPGTPPGSLFYETRITQLVAAMTPDVALDRARWGVPGWGSPAFDFPTAITQLRNDYLAPRRPYLYVTHGPGGTGLVPAAQGATMVRFGAYERSPASGNQDEEYVEIQNFGATAVDLSGWELDSGITFTFPPGAVIPAMQSAYVSPKVFTFRSRALPPTGGQRLFVLGPYSGHISPIDTVRLLDETGAVVDVIMGITCGDCDGDMMTTILDALTAAQHASGLITLVDPQFAACNVNGPLGGTTVLGATVNILDALDLARSAAGFPVAITCLP